MLNYKVVSISIAKPFPKIIINGQEIAVLNERVVDLSGEQYLVDPILDARIDCDAIEQDRVFMLQEGVKSDDLTPLYRLYLYETIRDWFSTQLRPGGFDSVSDLVAVSFQTPMRNPVSLLRSSRDMDRSQLQSAYRMLSNGEMHPLSAYGLYKHVLRAEKSHSPNMNTQLYGMGGIVVAGIGLFTAKAYEDRPFSQPLAMASMLAVCLSVFFIVAYTLIISGKSVEPKDA